MTITLARRGVSCVAELLDKDAPRTCEAVWGALPQGDAVQHAKYARNEVYTMVPRFAATEPGRENPTVTPIPGDVVYFPEGPDGLHDFSNRSAEPVRMLAVSTKRFPDVVAYPERGVAWVATRHPERPVPKSGDEGIIARFDLPRGE